MIVIPLCVPYLLKDVAKRAGAKWNAPQRVWECSPNLLATGAYSQLQPFVPYRYRPELDSPYIKPRMVPQTLWGKNLRALLSKEQWDVIRSAAYTAAGNRCRICGGRGSKWPVEADEEWEYNDQALTHTLSGVIALCPDCHHVRHWGKTKIDGHEEEAFSHLMSINGWDRPQAEKIVNEAFDQWRMRSRCQWTSDYSWVARNHNFAIGRVGLERAEQANLDVVAKAKRHAEETERMFTTSLPLNYTRSTMPKPPAPSKPERRSLRSFLQTLFG